MTAVLNAAAKVTAPACRNSADPTHQFGLIFRVANVTTAGGVQATAADIPKECRGRYWRFLTRGATVATAVDVQFAWLFDDDGVGGADTAPSLIYDQLSATGTGHLSAVITLLDRTPEHFHCPDKARRIVFISSAASGFFEASLSGEKTGK